MKAEIDMEQYIFTFGVRHKLGKYHQPVFANNRHEAKQKMMNKYGLDWACQYPKEDWDTLRNLGYQKGEALEPIR